MSRDNGSKEENEAQQYGHGAWQVDIESTDAEKWIE